jgi:glyoxylase-like metal-dependent hydrolase (beta-lactamase superfamily II)
MKPIAAFLSVLAVSAAVMAAQSEAAKTLDIYVIDVEGGNAQLWVTPSGESVLVDSGNGGAAAVRDADRIMAAVKAAGVQIDHLITTHYHGDHVGGLPSSRHASPSKNSSTMGPTSSLALKSIRFCSSMRHSLARPSTLSRKPATGFP